jgi:hypothetical protein
MACISPPELDDTALLAYIDGEAAPQVIAHLKQCPHCRAKARVLARVQDRLTAQLYRLNCPSPLELGEYHLGLLPRDQAAALARHLVECPHCTHEATQLKDYLAQLKPDLAMGPLERVRTLVARLISGAPSSGLLGQPALASAYVGVRGDEEGPLIYQADDVQVAIEAHEHADTPGRHAILGLVTGLEDLNELQVHLWQSAQRIATVPVDEQGNFVISDLAPASYELMLSGPAIEVHIQDLKVGTSG